jgi:hypothetical protein
MRPPDAESEARRPRNDVAAVTREPAASSSAETEETGPGRRTESASSFASSYPAPS